MGSAESKQNCICLWICYIVSLQEELGAGRGGQECAPTVHSGIPPFPSSEETDFSSLLCNCGVLSFGNLGIVLSFGIFGKSISLCRLLIETVKGKTWLFSNENHQRLFKRQSKSSEPQAQPSTHMHRIYRGPPIHVPEHLRAS